MPFYNFECSNDECKEKHPNKLVKMGTNEIKCEKCGDVAKKTISYNFSSIGLPNGHITTRGNTKN